MSIERVWLVMVEAAMEPGELGFLNIALWASTSEDAIKRVEQYFQKFSWTVLSTERVIEVDPDHDYGAELNGLIQETLEDRNFIRLGTYFTYPPN